MVGTVSNDELTSHNRVLELLKASFARQVEFGEIRNLVVDDPFSLNLKTLTFLRDLNLKIECVGEFHGAYVSYQDAILKATIVESIAFQDFLTNGDKSDENINTARADIFAQLMEDRGLTEDVSYEDFVGTLVCAYARLAPLENLFSEFCDYHWNPQKGGGGLGKWERFLTPRLNADLENSTNWLPLDEYRRWEADVYKAEADLEPDRQDEFKVFAQRAMTLIEGGKLSPEQLGSVAGLDGYFVEGMQSALENFAFVYHTQLTRLTGEQCKKKIDRILNGRDLEYLGNDPTSVDIGGVVWSEIYQANGNARKEDNICQILQSALQPVEVLQVLVGDFFCDCEMSDYFPDLEKVSEASPPMQSVSFSSGSSAPEIHQEPVIQATKQSAVNFSDYRETEDAPRREDGGDYDTSPGDVFVTGEDGILEKICQTYQISTFEADEILSAHRAFEGSSINLKADYTIRYIETTEEFLTAKDRNKTKTGFFGKVAKLTTTLAKEPRNMWRKYRDTRALHRSLVKVIDTYELPKATNERPESIITAIYNIRNEASDISNAQATMEGRRIFDTLRRKEHLLERLDV